MELNFAFWMAIIFTIAVAFLLWGVAPRYKNNYRSWAWVAALMFAGAIIILVYLIWVEFM